jgi:hypothetical protein
LLSELNELERLAIAPGRPYMVVINVSGAKAHVGEMPVLQGQIICFPQPDAAQQVVNAVSLPHTDTHRLLSLSFVGPRDQFEKWSSRQRALILMTRFRLMIDTLRALKALHPAYEHIVIDESAATAQYFSGSFDDSNSLVSRVVADCNVISDPDVCDVDVVSRSSDPAAVMPQVWYCFVFCSEGFFA